MQKALCQITNDSNKTAVAQTAHKLSKARLSKSSTLPKPEPPEQPLTKEELEVLTKCENVVDRNKLTFLLTGQALTTIRDQRLYRATHKTFEEYTKERFGFSRAYANRLISGCEVAKQLKLVDEDLAPRGAIRLNEKLLRPLTSLPEERRPETWQKALELADGKPVQAKHVQAVIPKKVKELALAVKEAKTTSALANLRKLIEQAKADAKAVLAEDNHIQELLNEVIERIHKVEQVRKEEAKYAAI